MGINVILRGMIAIFSIGFIFMALMPYIYALATDNNLWSEVLDPRAIWLRDNALNIFYITGIVGIFSTIVWIFNASDRKGAISSY